MSLQYKIENIEAKILDKVTCDRCGKEIEKISEHGWNGAGEPYTNFFQPSFKDFFLLKSSWGYYSKKDGDIHEAVICEPCYDEIFKDVKMKVRNDWGEEVLG